MGSSWPLHNTLRLFAILGTTYGGNGTTTFALPNLQGRAAFGAGNGPGLPSMVPGQIGGSPSVTLIAPQMPAHTHQQMLSNVAATTAVAAGNITAQSNGADSEGTPRYGERPTLRPEAGSLVPASPLAIGVTGSNQPVNVMPPYLGMNYIICIQGLFPSRD